MNIASLRVLKIAFTFTGTLIGAGFASGQELLQFFLTYGKFGFISIIIMGLLFAWLSYILLTISSHFQLASYHDFIQFSCGKTLTPLFEYILCFFWFTVLVIMLAAAGDIAESLLQIEPTTCQIIFAFLTVLAAGNGIKSIGKINLWAMPFLTLVIAAVSINSLQYHSFAEHQLCLQPLHTLQPAPHWLLACLLYVAYNLALSAAVLVPLGSITHSQHSRKYGSILGSGLLTCLALLIAAALLLHLPYIITEPLPMLTISCTQTSLHTLLYGIAFIMAMFTTATACLYASASKFSHALSVPYQLCLPFTAIAAFSGSGTGFSELIATLFPIFGYFSLFIFICLIYKYKYH